MTWMLAGLAGLVGVIFFLLWKHERVERIRAQSNLEVERTLRADAAARFEKLVASLKADIRRLEEAALAHATPDELRARLTELLRPH